MDNVKYILKTNEAVLMPVEVNKKKIIIKKCVWLVDGIIIFGSILFGGNLLAGMSWMAIFFLVILTVKFGFYNGEEDYMASPMELHFYEDRLVLYLPKRYYSKRVTRKQINTMKYADISRCVYDMKSKKVHIHGDGHTVWYNYKKDGSLPSTPTEERNFTQGMIFFDTRLATDVDFIKEIEEHSPLKVIVENS